MNDMQKKNAARAAVMTQFTEMLDSCAAVQFADSSFAILQEVEGQEIWVEVTFKAKAFKPTKLSPPFDPFETAQVWQEEKKIKEQEKAEKAKEKERKIAASEKKRKENAGE